jgi:hypothetical protein
MRGWRAIAGWERPISTSALVEPALEAGFREAAGQGLEPRLPDPEPRPGHAVLCAPVRACGFLKEPSGHRGGRLYYLVLPRHAASVCKVVSTRPKRWRIPSKWTSRRRTSFGTY